MWVRNSEITEPRSTRKGLFAGAAQKQKDFQGQTE
jgi:hypothetical protein